MLIYSLCNRYKEEKFLLYTYSNVKLPNNLPKNLTCKKYNEFIFRTTRKLGKYFNRLSSLENRLINKCDNVIVIGGSLFMESKRNLDLSEYSFWYKNIKKPYYILGSNIGPVYSTEYINEIKDNVFSKAKDVCLRDNKSYEYVSELKNVRVSTDIIFSYDVSKYRKVKEENKVIISVIDISKKAGQIVNPDLEKYEQKILELIKFFVNREYEIELMSFCKEEGDEIAIESIFNKSEFKNKIKKYYYNGNVEEALSELATAKTIIGTRFHANIIGFLLNKNVIPVIYNDKTRNMLEDISFEGKYIDIENMDNFNIKELKDEDLKYLINIDKHIRKAESQFKILDEVFSKDERLK
ncbi:MAG: polysaccharide pyruvyl transferase family protein [Clostridia bacterium]|nr:polysaccharide pyruvyl transferase family protein [Clostridia bacterium]